MKNKLYVASGILLSILCFVGCGTRKIPNEQTINSLIQEHNSEEADFLHIDKFDKIQETDKGFTGYATLNNKIDDYYSLVGTIKIFGKYDKETKRWYFPGYDLSESYKKLTYNVEGSWHGVNNWQNDIEITNQTDSGMDIYIAENGFGNGSPIHVEAVAYNDDKEYIYESYPERGHRRIKYKSAIDENGRSDVEVVFTRHGEKGLKVTVSSGIYDYKAWIVADE